MTKEIKPQQALVKAGNKIATYQSPADILKYAKSLVQDVIDSDFARNFEHEDKDGKTTINKADIINNIVLGNEMGITPVASLALGRKLNIDKYFSVIRGKAMGLDPVTSMHKIHNIDIDGKITISADVAIINKCILDAGVETEIIRDARTVPLFYDVLTKEYIGHKYDVTGEDNIFHPEYHLLPNQSDKELDNAKLAMSKGLIIIEQKGNTKVTTIKFSRPSSNTTIIISYSLQQAINARLMRGFQNNSYDEDGKPVWYKGRPQWINHPETMLRNRVLSIGGRIIAADRLQGIYSNEEALDMVEPIVEDIDIQTVPSSTN